MTSLADVLILDTASMQWRLAKETATRPRARFFHTATSLEQDARVVIFGGATGSTEGEDQAFLNDTWLFLTRASSWEPCQVSGKPPSPRAAHTAVFVSSRTQLAVFGGFNGQESLNDLWIMHVGSPRWELVNNATGTPPTIRGYHTASIHGARLSALPPPPPPKRILLHPKHMCTIHLVPHPDAHK